MRSLEVPIDRLHLSWELGLTDLHVVTVTHEVLAGGDLMDVPDGHLDGGTSLGVKMSSRQSTAAGLSTQSAVVAVHHLRAGYEGVHLSEKPRSTRQIAHVPATQPFAVYSQQAALAQEHSQKVEMTLENFHIFFAVETLVVEVPDDLLEAANRIREFATAAGVAGVAEQLLAVQQYEGGERSPNRPRHSHR
jgi:hypothetical protein